MGGLWTEQKSITRRHELLHRCRQTFVFDDIHVLRDDLALPLSLREVIERRNRLSGSRREAAASRGHVRVDRIQAMRCGFRACCRQRSMARDYPPSIPARFQVVGGGFVLLKLMRETASGHVEMMPRGFRVMPGHYFRPRGTSR